MTPTSSAAADWGSVLRRRPHEPLYFPRREAQLRSKKGNSPPRDRSHRHWQAQAVAERKTVPPPPPPPSLPWSLVQFADERAPQRPFRGARRQETEGVQAVDAAREDVDVARTASHRSHRQPVRTNDGAQPQPARALSPCVCPFRYRRAVSRETETEAAAAAAADCGP
jgi:hypothetical protein